jgi:hypothetical protein
VSESPTIADRQIARAAGVVMVGFLLANLTGLFRQILVSQVFGTRAELDAFFAALRLPDLLFSLIAGGALMGDVAQTLALCPGCIEGSSAKVQAGFQWSILFMMTVPYLAVGLIGGGLFLAHRRAVRDEVERVLRSQDEGARTSDARTAEGSL